MLKLIKTIDSGDVFKVKSKISKIHKILIATKLRTIDVGDVQVLEVFGYDQDENVFSTLEGLRFHWKLEQNDNILEFVLTKVFISLFIHLYNDSTGFIDKIKSY